MRRLILVFFMIAALPLRAADPDEASYWSNIDLKAFAGKLDAKVNADHFALERLGEFGSHNVLVVHRAGKGPAEAHDTETDFYVVQHGEATLYVGGEIVDAKTVEPGEIRGSSIRGGKKFKLQPGDTVNIPPKTPHHVVLEPGQKVTYMIVKIPAK